MPYTTTEISVLCEGCWERIVWRQGDPPVECSCRNAGIAPPSENWPMGSVRNGVHPVQVEIVNGNA